MRLIAAIGLLLSSAVASAVTIELTDITGSWINVVPGADISVSGDGTSTPSMRWGSGVPLDERSGYDFVATSTPLMVDTGVDFDLGTLTHLNNPIFPPSLESATLQLIVSFVSFGDLTFEYDFTHNETPNVSSDCPSDPVPCNDIVSFANNLSVSSIFSIDGVDYSLLISGFEVAGSLVDEFRTVEGRDNTATLRASISPASVPAPAALALLGLGLMGLGVSRRRRLI